MTSERNGALNVVCFFIIMFFVKLITVCKLCIIYVREFYYGMYQLSYVIVFDMCCAVFLYVFLLCRANKVHPFETKPHWNYRCVNYYLHEPATNDHMVYMSEKGH